MFLSLSVHSDQAKAAESWRRYLRIDDSRIVDLFVGQLKSTLQCSTCGHKSVTFDPFWDLSLPIADSRCSAQSLQQCLELFTHDEVLDGDEKPVSDHLRVEFAAVNVLASVSRLVILFLSVPGQPSLLIGFSVVADLRAMQKTSTDDKATVDLEVPENPRSALETFRQSRTLSIKDRYECAVPSEKPGHFQLHLEW